MRYLLLAFLLCVGATASRATEPELLVQKLQFPEGTIFVDNMLYFVDYKSSDIFMMRDGRSELVRHLEGCGANGLLEAEGGLLVACFTSGEVVFVPLKANLASQPVATLISGLKRPNDFAGDGKGGVYMTVSGGAAPDLGKVFYKAPGKAFREVATDIAFANGVAVSPDGAMLYVGETQTDRIYSFAISADGSLTGKKTFVLLTDLIDSGGKRLGPDGIRVDRDGRLFVAMYYGAGVAVIEPDGSLLTTLAVPGANHTNLATSSDRRFIYATSIDDGKGSLYRLANVPARAVK